MSTLLEKRKEKEEKERKEERKTWRGKGEKQTPPASS